MSLEIVVVPCLSDNYAYLVHSGGETALIDAPEAGPIEAELDRRGWTLDTILITHHHRDHVDGVARLRDRSGARVIGPKAEESTLPDLDRAVGGGDTGTVGEAPFTVMAVPGHTLGHIAYHFPEDAAVFTADSLMALGCGRVFEGTPEMMWDSLQKLAALPGETRVYSGHEYTQGNARFALTVDPENSALKSRADAVARMRADDQPTVPSQLSEEMRTNPFLRAADADMKRQIGMPDAPDAAVFAEIRRRKDAF